MASHPSILAWKIPRAEPGGLYSRGLQRVRHNWATELTCIISGQAFKAYLRGYMCVETQIKCKYVRHTNKYLKKEWVCFFFSHIHHTEFSQSTLALFIPFLANDLIFCITKTIEIFWHVFFLSSLKSNISLHLYFFFLCLWPSLWGRRVCSDGQH